MNIGIDNIGPSINRIVKTNASIKKENIKDDDEKVDDKKQKEKLAEKKKKRIRYLREGDVIKVYSYEADKKECIKVIPLVKASSSDLSKVENLSFKEMLKIIQMQRNCKA